MRQEDQAAKLWKCFIEDEGNVVMLDENMLEKIVHKASMCMSEMDWMEFRFRIYCKNKSTKALSSCRELIEYSENIFNANDYVLELLNVYCCLCEEHGQYHNAIIGYQKSIQKVQSLRIDSRSNLFLEDLPIQQLEKLKALYEGKARCLAIVGANVEASACLSVLERIHDHVVTKQQNTLSRVNAMNKPKNLIKAYAQLGRMYSNK